MQQPIYQEQQSSQQGQGTGQQMLLCPVRLVYETQILVQPGDQIHPNQTILINPHNPPPWIQNRPQNQVIYVQQMAPNNFMPQVQQQAGQNQLYMHQNFNNFQQIMPQQIITQAQHEEVRSANVQMANMLPRNTVQNVQSNHGSNNPNMSNDPTMGSSVSNFGMLPPYYSNIQNQIAPNQINLIHNNVTNKQNVVNVQTPPKHTATAAMQLPRNVEMQQNVYRQIIPQVYQHENNMVPTSLSQAVTMTPMQNTPVFQKPITNSTLEQNITHIRPLQSQTAHASSIHPPVVSSVSNLTNERIVRKVATIVPKGNTITSVLNTGVKNASTTAYSYRPIQPRPQQQRNNTPNLMPNTQSQIVVPMKPPTIANNMNTQNYVIPATIPLNQITAESNAYNRKRKSESPDEIQKKVAIKNVPQKITATTSMESTNTFHDVGVNTIPMQKSMNKTINPITVTPSISNSQTINQSNTTKMAPHMIKENLQQTETQPDKEVNTKQNSETEKLLRNTVFTQARNRVLSDKQEIVNTDILKAETKACDIKVEPVLAKEINKDVGKEINNTKEIKIKSEEIQHPTVADVKNENKSNKTDEKQTFKEINLLGNGKTTQENGFVLTHVLDGYVIQESNFAFPIRKPLKEKTIHHNVGDLEVKKEDSKNDKALNDSKIFSLSFLQLNESETEKRLTDDKKNEDCKEKVVSKDDPFVELKPTTVKTWTVEQLSVHLLKYDWDETVSVLREHEIDGESLFLVSKNQLMNIGVSEDHASAICEFVKS